MRKAEEIWLELEINFKKNCEVYMERQPKQLLKKIKPRYKT